MSGEMAVRETLKQVLTGLGPLAMDADELATVELVLAEAMNNIVEHAYPEADAQGPIRIGCTHKVNGLHFTIVDEGKPMPGGQMPIGLAQNVDVDPLDMPEGGFGWFLIRDLAKEVRYQRVGQDNQLDLRIAVAIHRK
jgi:serine/threonine-protein kinase RsbW